jgi:hypothetical protein
MDQQRESTRDSIERRMRQRSSLNRTFCLATLALSTKTPCCFYGKVKACPASQTLWSQTFFAWHYLADMAHVPTIFISVVKSSGSVVTLMLHADQISAHLFFPRTTQTVASPSTIVSSLRHRSPPGVLCSKPTKMTCSCCLANAVQSLSSKVPA